MSIVDITGSAMLSKVYRHTGPSKLALGLFALLAWRAYQNRSRITDMIGGAMAGIGKLPAMVLPLLHQKPARKSRGAAAKQKRGRRSTGTRKSRAPAKSHSAASHAVH